MSTLKKLLLSAVLVFSAHYSYSESIAPYYDQTGNAALGGNRWSMDNVLPPDIPGLDITGVIYNYRINKATNDHVDVYVQNENANGSGYIFREHDEWRPGSLSGTQINKVVPVVPSNRALWGDGSIDVQGNGSVDEARVLYNYKVDPCFNPQFDPNCPGYVRPTPTVVEVDLTTIYDAMSDENVNLNLETDQEVYDDEEKELTDEELAEKEAEEKKDREERLEKALAAVDNSAMFANAFGQSMILQQQNNRVNMNQYYSKFIAGGSYDEVISLDGGNIPDNPQGRRLNFSTQKLHEEMVDMQYK